MIHRIISAIERTLFPPRCLLDAGPASRVDLADHLVAALPLFANRPHCPICGSNVAGDHPCGACLKSPPAFEKVQAAFWLDETLKTLLHRLKYGSRPDIRITRLLSTLSSAHLAAGEVEALIPMPLHPQRLTTRGFNQAEWLARDWGRALELPVLPVARRTRNTAQQARLDAKARRRNLQNAFSVDEARLSPLKRVAIVDDVLTTGATADALAQIMRRAHPDLEVEVWVVARTPLL